jgi:hypothetical protein
MPGCKAFHPNFRDKNAIFANPQGHSSFGLFNCLRQHPEHFGACQMKTVIFETIFGIVLFCAALALMLAYFDVLVK